MRTPTNVDLDILARTIFGEAEGEPLQGKIAVGNVVVNRARAAPVWGWPDSIREVCRQDGQFECWETYERRRLLDNVTLASPVFIECWEAAARAINPERIDESMGADHFHELSTRAIWADSDKVTVTLYRHRFYRLRP